MTQYKVECIRMSDGGRYFVKVSASSPQEARKKVYKDEHFISHIGKAFTKNTFAIFTFYRYDKFLIAEVMDVSLITAENILSKAKKWDTLSSSFKRAWKTHAWEKNITWG